MITNKYINIFSNWRSFVAEIFPVLFNAKQEFACPSTVSTEQRKLVLGDAYEFTVFIYIILYDT